MTSKETADIKKAIWLIKKELVPNGEALAILYGLIADEDSLAELKKVEDAFKQKEAKRLQAYKDRTSKQQLKTERWDNSPEWFKKYYGGVSERLDYSIFAESTNWAIIKKEGHTSYLNRMSGSKYFPATYCLICKTSAKDYGHSVGQEVVFEGRLRKGDEEKIKQRLADSEAKGT